MPAKLVCQLIPLQDKTSILFLKSNAYEREIIIDDFMHPFVERHRWYWNTTTGQVSGLIDGTRTTLHHFIIRTWYGIEHVRQTRLLKGPLDLRVENIWFPKCDEVAKNKNSELAKIARSLELTIEKI